jgi:acyl-coenzyme A synthetase/AMP-(fatty) acid ligase
VIKSDESQLLIPPRFQDAELEIPPLRRTDKHIGLFSSGTTGKPKGIWNSFDNLKQNGIYTAEAFGVKQNHKLLILAAPWHVAGLSWAIMAEKLGCNYEFITTKKGDDENWFKAVGKFQPDFMLTVPAVLRALYNRDWHVPNVVFGGYSIEPKDFELLAPHCDRMIQGYGQTEAGGLIAARSWKSEETKDELDHLCCGKPIEGVKLSCNGTPNNPKLIFIDSQTSFTSKEYNAGDLGFMDNEGQVYLLGRADEIVNSK